MLMIWLYLATGFTGAFTLQFLFRQLVHLFVAKPSVEVRITNGADSLDGLLADLQRARREILVLARSFTARPVAQALIDAKMRGVKIEVLLDPSCERDRSSDLSFLLEQGLRPLAAAPNAISTGAVILVDGRTVYVGGFSSPADLGEDTSADLLCIKGYPEAVAAYRLHFANEKSDARPAENKPQPAPAAPSRMPTPSTPPLAPSPQRVPSSPTLPATAATPSIPPLPASLATVGSAGPPATPPTAPTTAEPPVKKVA
jgi:PLD-like domain